MSFGRSKTDDQKLQKIESMYERTRRSFPEVPEITPEDALRLMDEEGTVVVDVRTPTEQAVSMIPGAITAEEFEANRARYEGATVLAYCTVGQRSGLFVQELMADGWKVFNIVGAILAWTHAGGPLVDSAGPTPKVHVYSRRSNLVAEGYEGVW